MKINLKDYYPAAYSVDFFVEVDDAVAAVLRTEKQERHALMRRIKRNGIVSLEEYELKRKVLPRSREQHLSSTNAVDAVFLRAELFAAMSKLSEHQARRIYKHFFLGMSKAEIARSENVSVSSVKDSIRLGLKRMCELLS